VADIPAAACCFLDDPPSAVDLKLHATLVLRLAYLFCVSSGI
jgi:ABC-type hemin transport system ATPase subunit